MSRADRRTGESAASPNEPYAGSTAVRLLSERLGAGGALHLAFLDVDSTLTGDADGADEVRDRLETIGYVAGFVTSRTEEMLMSSASFGRSRDEGLDRPPPKLGVQGEAHVYVPPEDVLPRGLLDGDLISGSSGSRILVRQIDGSYRPDEAYGARFGASPDAWRAGAFSVLEWVKKEGCGAHAAPIEQAQSYYEGHVDVFPPHYRMQVDFPTLHDKLCFARAFAVARRENVHGARTLRITDDSHPEEERYKLFITPRTASKARAVERMVDALCRAARVDRAALSILFAGDSFPDLAMGLLAAPGTTATLLLAGGSRLAQHLVSGGSGTFAGEPLRAFRRRLTPTERQGYYRFRVPGGNGGTRMLVIGDAAFPGTHEVETVIAYLRELAHEAG